MDSTLKKKLWAAADKLRCNMDAAEYKHVVLGLIFLKYVSDGFEKKQNSLLLDLANPDHEYFVENEADRKTLLEDRDYYTADNVFWVPEVARWPYIQQRAKHNNIGKIIDDAMIEVEKENPKLKNILDKRYARTQSNLPANKLGEIVDLISGIGFNMEDKSKDVIGEVFEYFLGEFASAEGKKGGQFYTPASVVRTLVEILQPYKGRIFDPACGSAGMFIQSEAFIKAHGGITDDLSIYGQESNPTTWRLAAMNLVTKNYGFNLGKEPDDSFHNDQHPDLRADFVIANPPFNVSDWGQEKALQDPRWKYGIPPKGNANYAWIQHILHHMNEDGRAGVVLSNGSMNTSQKEELAIRSSLVDQDIIECMVSLPTNLFFNTTIPACEWFLNKNKANLHSSCKNKVLFIDARNLGTMATRVIRVLSDADIRKIADTYIAWSKGENYKDILGFCKSVDIKDIKKNDYSLNPSSYVGIEKSTETKEQFDKKMKELRKTLKEQMSKSDALDKAIVESLKEIGYE